MPRIAKLCILALILVAGIPVRAVDTTSEAPLRPVAAAYTLELGASSLADTYLSPITYKGWSTAIAYERMQAMRFNPEQWVMQLETRFALDRGTNIADNATMWRIDASARWGMMRRWDMPVDGLRLGIGGSTGISIGAIYSARNGNNPASAKAAWTVNLTAFATYSTRIGRLPITLRYQPTMPMLGAFFSPDYDELYYEIYLGNREGLAHFAWLGNRFLLDNYLTADLRFRSTILRIGYRNYTMSSGVNNITTNIATNSFVIGIAGEWLSVPQRSPLSTDASIISAIY